MTCSGNPAEICGGPDLLSVYSSSPPQAASVATIKKTGLPETWAYQGCYSDNIGNRDFGPDGVEIDSETLNTAEYCLGQCYSLGFNGAGTEYGSQCFCGNTTAFAAVNPTLLGDAQCNMVCTGDITETCGGLGAIAYYTLQ